MSNIVEKAAGALAVFVGGLALVVVVGLIGGFFTGWLFMLLLGDLHHNISGAVPAVGYWACFWPAFLANILFGRSTTSATSS